MNEKKIVCYYTNWAWRRASFGSFTPEDIDGQLCTHIVYAFATLDAETFLLNIDDSADVYRSFLNKAAEVRRKNGVKVLLGLGGWNDSKNDKYSRLAGSPRATRKTFVEYVVRIIEQYGFDGLDLDWEFPVCWQVNRNILPSSFLSLSLLCNYNNSSSTKYQGYFGILKETFSI